MYEPPRMRRRLLTLLLFATLLTIPFSLAQTPNVSDEQKMLALIMEVQTQQAQIADNQAKIDNRLADLAETIRVARIFSKQAK